MSQSNPSLPERPAEVVVSIAEMRKLLCALLVRKSMFQFDAETVAQRMLDADCWGLQQSGCRCILQFLDAMDRGQIDPRARVLVEHETSAMAVLDGSSAMGHVAASRGMQIAIDKARAVGTGTVVIHHSHHLGAAILYSRLAAEQGMIGLCTTSIGPATVALANSSTPVVANHSISCAIPNGESPLVIDLISGPASWEAIAVSARDGVALPAGIAIDAEGAPTCDPARAAVLLTAAASQGFGMALLASVFAGLLAGGRFPVVKPKTNTTAGEHFMMAIDVGTFTDVSRFSKKITEGIAAISGIAACSDAGLALSDRPDCGSETIGTDGSGVGMPRKRVVSPEATISLHHVDATAIALRARALKVDIPWTT